MKPWSIQLARKLYNVDGWGKGYFDINHAGHATVKPQLTDNYQEIDLYNLADTIQAKGYSLPILVRFPDILVGRVNELCCAFDRAIEEEAYQGQHTAVYPIKVNQQRTVVEHIAGANNGRVGLEVGSKTELMAVLAQVLSPEPSGGTVICNGYKDREYIRLALIGQKFGKRIFIVIEQLNELKIILEEARKLSLKPKLGVRVRLASLGKGHWQNTGGQKSKFGLVANQLLSLVQELKNKEMLDALELLHFHMGSQIAELQDITRGMQEASNYLVELHKLGAAISVIDVGGGVGIDYDGTSSGNTFSINYSFQEYSVTIIKHLMAVCSKYDLLQPEIITEVGRALTAHHAVLITNVIEVESPGSIPLTIDIGGESSACFELVKAKRKLYDEINKQGSSGPLSEWLDKHEQLVLQAHNYFSQAIFSLQERVELEQLIYLTSAKLIDYIYSMDQYVDVLKNLNERIADKYFCNFSIFQSTPDIWGLDQVFPILPLNRLNEKPDKCAILYDITCDSDGHIEFYIDGDGLGKTIPLHKVKQDEQYLLGIFLVGAYQETLGDIHNLFGDTHTINVVTDDKGYHFEEFEPGDRADELLRYLHYDTEQLLQQYRTKLDNTSMDTGLKKQYFEELKEGLSGYTYLEE